MKQIERGNYESKSSIDMWIFLFEVRRQHIQNYRQLIISSSCTQFQINLIIIQCLVKLIHYFVMHQLRAKGQANLIALLYCLQNSQNLFNIKMSENDDADPYLEYQQFLGKNQDQTHQTQFVSNPISQFTTNNHQQPAIVIQSCKKEIVSVFKVTQNFTSGQPEKQRVDETIKRSLQSRMMSPQYLSRNEQTKNEIRMKIIFENNRLKASIETLRQELEVHRSNQLKIASILKQSKQKICDLKSLVKQKSKKVSQLSQKNIDLRCNVRELEEKVTQLNSFSEWQQGQIRELKKELQEKRQQKFEETVLQNKIENLQQILKSYEVQVHRYEQRFSNTFSKSSHEGDIPSSEHLQDRVSEHWGTMNQLQIKDIESLKQKQTNHEEQNERLININANLKIQLAEVEKQLQITSQQLNRLKLQYEKQTESNIKKCQNLEDEMEVVLKKSLNMDSEIKDRKAINAQLEQQLHKVQKELEGKIQNMKQFQNKYTVEIQQLTKLIEGKEEMIGELRQRLKQKDDAHQKEVNQLELDIEEKEEKYANQFQQIHFKLEEVRKKNTELQHLQENYKIRLQLEISLREQYEEKEKEARQFLQEKSHLQEELFSFKDAYLKIKEEAKLLSERLSISQETIRMLQEEKNKNQSQLDKYAQEINSLKVLLANLSRKYTDDEENYNQKVIEEQEQESEGSLENSEKVESNEHSPKLSPQIGSQPLAEQEQLSEPLSEPYYDSNSQTSDQITDLKNEILHLKKENVEMQKKYKKYIEVLREEFRLEKVELEYQFDQERQNDEEKGQKVEELSNSVRLLLLEVKSLRNNLKDKEKYIMQASNEMKSLNAIVSNQNEELKIIKNELVELQVELEKQRQKTLQLSSQVVKLEEEKKGLQDENSKLLDIKVDLENQLDKIKYNYMVESSKISLQYAKQVDELKNQLSAQLQKKIEEENKLFLSQQIIQKEKQIETQTKQTVQSFQLTIQELKNSIEFLSSTNDHIKAQMEHLHEKNALYEQEKKNLENLIEEKQRQLSKMKGLAQREKELVGQVQSLQLERQQMRLELERVKSQSGVYSCELDSKKAENETIKSKLSLVEEDMKQKKDKYLKEREQLRQKLNTLDSIINQQRQHIEKESVEKLKQSENFTHLNSKTKILETEKQILSRETEQLKSLITQINQQLEELKKQNQQLKQRQTLMNEKNKGLDKTIQDLQDKLAKILQEQNNRDSQFMNMRISLQLSQTSHKEEVNHLISSFAKQKQSELTIKLQEIQKLNEMIISLRSEITNLQLKQKAAEGSYQQRLRETEKERQDLILKNCQSCARIEQLNQSLFSFSQTVKLKSTQLELKQQSLTDIENILTNKKIEEQQFNSKIEELENALRVQSKDFTTFRDSVQREKKQKEDELEIAKKMLQDIEDDHELKIKKLNKELANHKILLEEAHKENSYRLEESNRSITNVKNQLKVHIDLLKQKEEEIKEIRHANSSLKETLEKLKKQRLRQQEEKTTLTKQKESLMDKLIKVEGQISSKQKELNATKEEVSKMTADINRKQETISSLNTKIKGFEQQAHQIKLQAKKQQDQIQSLNKNIISQKEKVKEIKQDLSKTQNHLQEEIIEKTKLQYQCEMLEENLTKTKQKLISIENQIAKEEEVLCSSKKIIDNLEHDKVQLNTMLTSIQKEHSFRIQSLREQQRNHYLLMERKYTKEVEQLCQQMSILRNQRDSFKELMEKNKKGDKELQEEMENLKERIKQDDEWLSTYQEERTQLNDKISQLTQDNNEINEVIESLRNDLMFKNDQIYEMKEQIQRLTEELNRVPGASCDSSKSIPLSIQTDRVALEDMIEKLEAINRQLLAKNQILQNQLNDKIKKERDLIEQVQKYRERETRDRHNSADSKVSKSKIFNDEKSENLENTVQTLKLQLEEAQAYIHQLQDEIEDHTHHQKATHVNTLEERIRNLEQHRQQLKMKVEEQEAYIEHLETDNIKASIISKRSTKSKKLGKHLHVDKDHSVISQDNSQQMANAADFNKQIYNKINMINQFIENYKKDNSSMDKEEEFRKTLNNPYLDELLNTVFYKLEKQSNILKEKEHEIGELQMENQELRQELKSSKELLEKLTQKIELYDNIEKKYEDTKIMLEEALMIKLKQESHIAEKNRIIQELSEKNFDHNNSKEQALKYSSKNHKKEDKLSVLKEADEEEQSESMMDPDLDSEIPSQVRNSREFRMSLELPPKPMRTTLSQRLNMNKVVSIEGQIIYDRSTSVDFLQRLLDEIDKIQNQMAYIQLDLQQKGDQLADLLADNKKLSQIESKVCQNDKEIRSHMEKSESELIQLVRDILKFRQSQDQYGLQSENRQKIEECLNVLEKQLQKSSQINEVEEIKLFQASDKKKLSPTKKDVSNDSKNYSKTERGDYKIDENQELNQLRKQNEDLMGELRKTNTELTDKEGTILKMNQIIGLVNRQIGTVFGDILMNCQDNKYLMDQIDSLKRYLAFVFSQENLQSLRERNPSPQKLNESGRMILMDKRKSFDSDQKKQHVNHFEELLRLSNSQFIEQGEELANQHIKTLQKRLEEMTQLRYEDCMDFLLCEESLILSILKISEEESTAEQTMEKLASKFTKHQMANIIENCHNPVQARKILNRVLLEDQEKSFSEENDFSPDPQKLQEIRKIVYPHPTELCLSIHNQLLKILTAPTRQVFYDLIEQFYKMLRRFEESIKEEADERDSHSQSNSIQMKKILNDPVTDQDFRQMEKFKLLEYKNLKGRSGSCRIPGSEANIQ